MHLLIIGNRATGKGSGGGARMKRQSVENQASKRRARTVLRKNQAKKLNESTKKKLEEIANKLKSYCPEFHGQFDDSIYYYYAGQINKDVSGTITLESCKKEIFEKHVQPNKNRKNQYDIKIESDDFRKKKNKKKGINTNFGDVKYVSHSNVIGSKHGNRDVLDLTDERDSPQPPPEPKYYSSPSLTTVSHQSEQSLSSNSPYHHHSTTLPMNNQQQRPFQLYHSPSPSPSPSAHRVTAQINTAVNQIIDKMESVAQQMEDRVTLYLFIFSELQNKFFFI